MNSDQSSESASTQSRRYRRMFVLGMLLLVGWLLWSGLYKPLLLALGALSCVLTLYLVKRMGYFDNDTYAIRYKRGLVRYSLWLGVEVVRSSLEVARVILQPRLQVAPKIVSIDAKDLDIVDQALLGNSITLTPGTLTMDVHEGRLLVHTLTADGAAALEGGEMLRRVKSLGSR